MLFTAIEVYEPGSLWCATLAAHARADGACFDVATHGDVLGHAALLASIEALGLGSDQEPAAVGRQRLAL